MIYCFTEQWHRNVFRELGRWRWTRTSIRWRTIPHSHLIHNGRSEDLVLRKPLWDTSFNSGITIFINWCSTVQKGHFSAGQTGQNSFDMVLTNSRQGRCCAPSPIYSRGRKLFFYFKYFLLQTHDKANTLVQKAFGLCYFLLKIPNWNKIYLTWATGTGCLHTTRNWDEFLWVACHVNMIASMAERDSLNWEKPTNQKKLYFHSSSNGIALWISFGTDWPENYTFHQRTVSELSLVLMYWLLHSALHTIVLRVKGRDFPI